MLTLGWTILPSGAEPWLFLIVGGLAVVLVSVSKAGFGSGFGLLSTPMMIYACGGDAPLAAGVLLPLLVVCDWVSMVKWWRQWNLRQVKLLLPGAIVGIGLGTAALWGMRNLNAGQASASASAALKLAIGLISLSFVTLQIVRRRIGASGAYQPAPWHGAGFGVVAGVTSTLAHAAGPVATMYLLPQRMAKQNFVATTVLFFCIVNALKLVPYVLLGMVRSDLLGASATLLPCVVVGVILGVWLHRKVGQRSFAGIVYVLLTLAGAHLTYQAARTLWF